MTRDVARAGSIRRRGARRAAAALSLAVASSLACAGDAPRAACVTLTGARDGAPIGAWDASPGDPLALRYVHSVTRTPVEERYVVDHGALRQVEIRFAEHGPGLPTEADAGAAWTREGGLFVVTLDRRFEAIAMRVDPAQAPSLRIGGATVDLAPRERRAVVLSARTSACPG